MTTGQMNVDRRVERHASLAPAGNVLGVPLGVGSGVLAAGIAGACDESGADRVGFDREAERFDPLRRCGEICGSDTGDEEILPDGKPQIAVAEFGCDGG